MNYLANVTGKRKVSFRLKEFGISLLVLISIDVNVNSVRWNVCKRHFLNKHSAEWASSSSLNKLFIPLFPPFLLDFFLTVSLFFSMSVSSQSSLKARSTFNRLCSFPSNVEQKNSFYSFLKHNITSALYVLLCTSFPTSTS